MRRFKDLRFAGVAALAVICGACGATSSPPSAPTTPFTVWIFDEGPTTTDEGAPLPNVMVALDPPGGGARVVRTTEADGHVTFDADFAAGGRVQVSAFSVNHTLVTMLDASPDTARAAPNTFGKPPEDLAIILPRLDASIRQAAIGMRGALTGKRDLSDAVSLSASSVRRLGSAETKTATYALRAPKNQAFFVLGHESGAIVDNGVTLAIEHVKSFRIDAPARPGDLVRDLDVGASTPLAVKTLRLHTDLPNAGSAPFVAGTRASAIVASAESTLLVGTFGGVSPGADGHGFDVKLVVADTEIAPERVETRAVLVAPDGSSSTRHELGVVADGTSWSDFLLPTPVDDADRNLTDPLPLAGFPAGADLRLEVFAAGQLVWILKGPPGGPIADKVTLPAPFGLDFPVSVQLVAVSIIALADRVPLPPHGELHRRVSTSRDMTLRRK